MTKTYTSSRDEIKAILLRDEAKHRIFTAYGVRQTVNIVYDLDKKRLAVLIEKLGEIYNNKNGGVK